MADALLKSHVIFIILITINFIILFIYKHFSIMLFIRLFEKYLLKINFSQYI